MRLLLLFVCAVAFGQNCERPLGANELYDLLGKRVSEVMVRQLITTCGVAMTVDGTVEAQLKKLGASPSLLALVQEKAISPARTDLELRAEIEFWSSIKESSEPALFEDYLKRYPTGRFVVLAQAKLRSLNTTVATVAPVVPSRPSSGIAPVELPIVARSWSAMHRHFTLAFSRQPGQCKGLLTVSPSGVAFVPDQPDGHTITVPLASLRGAEIEPFNNRFSVRVNDWKSEGGAFVGLTKGDADAIFDLIDQLMRSNGKFTGDATARNVQHMHGFVKYCKGIMTVTNNGLQFTSNDHNLTYTNTEYVMQAGVGNSSWMLQVIDRATQRKVAEFFINDWNNGTPLRSMWGKPKSNAKNGWLRWE